MASHELSNRLTNQLAFLSLETGSMYIQAVHVVSEGIIV